MQELMHPAAANAKEKLKICTVQQCTELHMRHFEVRMPVRNLISFCVSDPDKKMFLYGDTSGL
jgi:hypothetical protein